MSSIRLVLCDNGLVGEAGHHATLASAMSRETSTRGLALAIWSNVRIEPALARELGATPVFRSSPYDVAPSGAVAQAVSWGRCARRIAEDLARAAPEAGDVLLFPTARAAEVMAVGRWLSSASCEPAAVCMNFMLDDFRKARTLLASAWPLLYRVSLLRLGWRSGGRVLFTTGSPALTEALRKVGADARTYPMPSAYPPPRRSWGDVASSSEAAKVAFVGVPWPSKGGGLLADVLARCESAELPCRLVAQRPGTAHAALAPAEALAALARSPLVDLVQGPLDGAAYFRMLDDCDLVLLPYDPARYARMTSGVFAEALALGKPVVAPARTWMSEMLSSGHGAGVVFDRFEAGAIVQALRSALEQRAELTATARRAAGAWRCEQSLGAYVDRLLSDLSAATRGPHASPPLPRSTP